jgi:hypothetical protein
LTSGNNTTRTKAKDIQIKDILTKIKMRRRSIRNTIPSGSGRKH